MEHLRDVPGVSAGLLLAHAGQWGHLSTLHLLPLSGSTHRHGLLVLLLHRGLGHVLLTHI